MVPDHKPQCDCSHQTAHKAQRQCSPVQPQLHPDDKQRINHQRDNTRDQRDAHGVRAFAFGAQNTAADHTHRHQHQRGQSKLQIAICKVSRLAAGPDRSQKIVAENKHQSNNPDLP